MPPECQAWGYVPLMPLRDPHSLLNLQLAGQKEWQPAQCPRAKGHMGQPLPAPPDAQTKAKMLSKSHKTHPS